MDAPKIFSKPVANRRKQLRPPLKAEPPGNVRVGPLLPVVDLLREHGVELDKVLARAGLPAGVFDDAENWISFRDLSNLLEACAALTGYSNYGLLIGRRFRLPLLGVLGQLMANSPTVRDALRLAALHINLQDRGAVSMTLDLGEDYASLGYALFDGTLPAADQILDGAVAMQLLLLRELCGTAWGPVAVQLSHKRPRDTMLFKQHFGPRLEFNTQMSAIVFESRWLDHRIRGADPAVYANITAEVEKREAQGATLFAEQVRRAIYSMTITGSATSTGLARLFGMHERTFRRRLEDEGVTLRDLLGAVRREWSCHLLMDTELSVSDIAWILGYSDPTVFARAFRHWTDVSPSEWRIKHDRTR